MIRVLRTELRRSSAFWIAPALVAGLAAMLYFVFRAWSARWMPLALWQRETLFLVWPLSMAAGAWLGLRDRRSRMRELLATTARPGWQRAIPTAGALSIALALGYVVTFAAAGVQVGWLATYFPLGSLPVVAVGALSLVAAGVFGLAIGRMVPSPFTPPVLAVLGFLALLAPSLFSLAPTTINRPEPAAALLSPVITVFRRDFVTIVPEVHAGQLLWFGGLAASGFALLGVVRLRDRLLALVPAGLGLVLALAVLPPGGESDITDPDPKATALVCANGTPRVCVTAVHSGTLDELRDPGREALRILAAKLPQAPATVAEASVSWYDDDSRPQPADTLLVEFDVGADGAIQLYRSELIWELLDGAGAQRCANTVNEHTVARQAVAAWLLDRTPPEAALLDGADKVLQTLRALPPAEQTRRVAEFRRASLACEDRDLTAIITKDAAQ